MSKCKPRSETHTIIKCLDCGQVREIRNQDKHQVVRCVDCQKKYRRDRRNELRSQVGQV